MPKNIVFCADGTWNGTGGPDEIAGTSPTNVLKLFRMLAGDIAPGDEDKPEIEITSPAAGTSPAQYAKYLHGVGDSANILAQMAGGSLGLGLVARVLRGYTYISRSYQPGDSIYIVGFSRGAYTARALGGLIAGMGLLDWSGLGLNPIGSDDNGYKYAASAWYSYLHSRTVASQQGSLLGRIESVFADAPQFVSWLMWRPKFVANVPIAAIGVWETVGALGIPELDQSDTVRLDLLRFTDTTLSKQVAAGFHAVAADERRVDFSPTLWDDAANVTQRFFAGAHSDVGGGYPLGDESRLSDIALQWMQSQLRAAKVVFKSDAAVATDSTAGPMHAPWLEGTFVRRPSAPRTFPAKSSSQIRCDPSIGRRLGQTVITINPNAPTLDTAGPYVPLALIQAGYVLAQGLTVA